MFRLEEIRRSPIKSCMMERLPSAYLTEAGVLYDRHAVIVHADGPHKNEMITQRAFSKLALIKNFVDEGDGLLHYTVPGQGSVCISLNIGNNEPPTKKFKLHDDWIDGIDIGDQDGMLSKYLGVQCSLWLYSPQSPRMVSQAHARYFPPGRVNFQDKSPILLTAVESLAEFNIVSHLLYGDDIEDLEMDSLRPTFVFRQTEERLKKPYVEELWGTIQIGDAVIELCRPATRCSVVGVKQSSGERDPSVLKRMSEIRFGEGDDLKGVFMGVLGRVVVPGKVGVGDEVKLLSTKPIHEALADLSVRQREQWLIERGIYVARLN